MQEVNKIRGKKSKDQIYTKWMQEVNKNRGKKSKDYGKLIYKVKKNQEIKSKNLV